MFTEQLSQALSIPVANLPPGVYAANTVINGSTGIVGRAVGPIDMSKFKRVVGKVSVGIAAAIDATNTVVASFAAANVAVNAVCAAITTFTQISGGPTISLTAPNSCGTVELRADQMPANTQWLILTVKQTPAANMSAELWAGESHYKPANQYDCTNTSLLAGRSVM